MLETLWESTNLVPSASCGGGLWYHAIDGLIVSLNSYFHQIFRDGTYRSLGKYTNAQLAEYYDGGNYYPVYVSYGNQAVGFCGFSGAIINPPAWPTLTNYSTQMIERVNGADYQYIGGMHECYKYQVTPTRQLLTTYDMHHVLGGGIWSDIYRVDDDRFICFARGTGYVIIYNHRTQTKELQETLGAFNFAAWDRENQIIWTIQSSRKIKLFSLNSIPGTLSAPVFLSAVTKCGGARVRCRVTSSSGAGVEGIWVVWSLTTGYGELQTPYSKTDADGYAYNYYWPPCTGYSFPLGETINVEVEF